MGERISRSFRLDKGSTIKLGRSNSSFLVSESISGESARFTRYERISQSMRLPDEWNREELRHHEKRKKNKAVVVLARMFSRRPRGGDGDGKKEQVTGEKKKKSWYSSWMPDPNNRWPVQGW
ncbi:hypothetical protein ACHQM5_023005 [Ranunculus cassubicifolius]